jgi:hypothetical protein
VPFTAAHTAALYGTITCNDACERISFALSHSGSSSVLVSGTLIA